MTGDHSPPSTADTSKHSLDRPLPEGSCGRPEKIARVEEEVTISEEDDDGEGGEDRLEMRVNPNPRIQRYLIAIEYIGTRFSGAQQQSNARTVVGVLADAFHKFIGQPVSIFCSSRTDAGVHALSNVCHVDVERISKRKPGELLPPHEPAVVKRAVNHFLQKNEGDIMVIDVRCVPSDFHSRYRAQERTCLLPATAGSVKSPCIVVLLVEVVRHLLHEDGLLFEEKQLKYFYRLLSGPETLSTFEKDQAWHVSEELDLLAMQKACKVLVGRHDFSSFRAAGCQAKSPIRTLDELNVTEVVSSPHFPNVLEREQSNCWREDSSSVGIIKSESELSHVSARPYQLNSEDSNGEPSTVFGMRKQHRCFVVTARARSFLYHQVRLLVGVMKSVGTGDLTVTDVERILKAKTISAASPMAPACGLYLGHVKYDLPSDK